MKNIANSLKHFYQRYPGRTVILGAIILALLLLLFKSKAPTHSIEEPAQLVTTETVQPGHYNPIITLYGKIESPDVSQLTAAVTADVTAVKVRAGHQVQKGDLLIQLDDSELKLKKQIRSGEVQALKAQLAALTTQHHTNEQALTHERTLVELNKNLVTRQQQLQEQQYVAETQLEQAQQNLQRQTLSLLQRELAIANYTHQEDELNARLAQARASLKQTELDLQRTQIRAPFTGKVMDVPASPGERVQVGTPLVKLYANAGLEMRAQIPTKYLAPIKAALAQDEPITAQAVIDTLRFPLTLDRLAAATHPGRGGVDGFFAITDDSELLTLERTVELTLTLPAIEAFAIPATALFQNKWVYQVVNNELQAVSVEYRGITTINNQDFILISSDELAPGSTIITTQLPQARTGLKVRVQ